MIVNSIYSALEAIENHDAAAARLLSLLAFVNFEDIPMGIFNADHADALASTPTHTGEGLGAEISPSQSWRHFSPADKDGVYVTWSRRSRSFKLTL